MNTPNDGGPAITLEAFNKVVRERDEARAAARSSRLDYFAGHALAGFCANQDCVKRGTDWMVDHAMIAANAMLKSPYA